MHISSDTGEQVLNGIEQAHSDSMAWFANGNLEKLSAIGALIGSAIEHLKRGQFDHIPLSDILHFEALMKDSLGDILAGEWQANLDAGADDSWRNMTPSMLMDKIKLQPLPNRHAPAAKFKSLMEA